MSYEVPNRPWVKVRTDLFVFKKQINMVTVDYYSNFIEMHRLRNSSSSTVIKVLKMHFSRHGIPEVQGLSSVSI